jgi:F-type H+-transporting ATPase subunit b
MTLPLLLAAAAETAGEANVLERFGVEWHYVVWQVVSFLVVLVVLYKFGIKPVAATMEERNRKIESGIRYAEEMQAKLSAAQQSTEEQLRQAQHKAQEIVDEARRTAKEFLDKQTAEAASKANDLVARAQQAIELEHRKMLADARGEIARLVVATTQRVLEKELSDADRGRYNEAAARELTGA